MGDYHNDDGGYFGISGDDYGPRYTAEQKAIDEAIEARKVISARVASAAAAAFRAAFAATGNSTPLVRVDCGFGDMGVRYVKKAARFSEQKAADPLTTQVAEVILYIGLKERGTHYTAIWCRDGSHGGRWENDRLKTEYAAHMADFKAARVAWCAMMDSIA